MVILGIGFALPIGGGATARVLAYANGMRRHGAHVQVVIARPSEHPAMPRNTERSGVCQGVPFLYSGSVIPPSRGMEWHSANLLALLRAIPVIRRLARQRPIDAILFYGQAEPLSLAVAHHLAKSLGAKLLMDICENPFYGRKDTSARLMRAVADRYGFRFLDGAIPISRYLEDFIRPRLRPGARVLRVPILVDITRFPPPVSRTEKGGTIAYLGDFGHPGEVNAVIEAFTRIAADFEDWRLRLLGGTTNLAVMEDIRNTLNRIGLAERIETPGQIRHEDVPAELARADVMVLPRASGAFSQAGFPTKLGEYLATGRPVVVTATGEVPHFLEDGVDAYLVPPDDIDAFARRLHQVLSHPDEAEAVGRRGRETAQRSFDYSMHGRRLLDFIEEVS